MYCILAVRAMDFSEHQLTSVTLTNLSLSLIYNGGNGDGYANEMLLATTLDNTQLTALYNGGIGDGFHVTSLMGTTLTNTDLMALYSGGTGDGYALEVSDKNILEGLQLTFMFSGGDEDGFALSQLNNTTLNNTNLTQLFQGGQSDGYAEATFSGYLDPNQVVDLLLSAKVFLQGPLLLPETPGLMNDHLRAAAKLPTTSPYPDVLSTDLLVFNDGGIMGDQPVANNIVDWVWIEIRNANNNTQIIDQRSALLQRDGDVVHTDGISPVIMEGLTGDYFIVVKHRNHLGVMTAIPIALSTSNTNVDFTDGSTNSFGSYAQAQLASNTYALWAGKTDQNANQVRFLGANNSVDIIKDYILSYPTNLLGFITFTAPDYHNTDVDMNGFSKFSGANDDSNLIKDIILAHPLNILGFPTFQIQSTIPNN